MTKAVSEREEQEKLLREQRTRKSELTSLKNKLQDSNFAVDKSIESESRFAARKQLMDDKVKHVSAELAKAKKDYSDATAERMKFK
jgi:hypothetical protein